MVEDSVWENAPETDFLAVVQKVTNYSRQFCNQPRYSGYFGGHGDNSESRGPSYCSGEHAGVVAKLHHEQCKVGGYCDVIHPTKTQKKQIAKKKVVSELSVKKGWQSSGLSVPGLQPAASGNDDEDEDMLQLGSMFIHFGLPTRRTAKLCEVKAKGAKASSIKGRCRAYLRFCNLYKGIARRHKKGSFVRKYLMRHANKHCKRA